MSNHQLLTPKPEGLSALADGELTPRELLALFQAGEQDPAAFGHWDSYHVIGEALRSPGRTVELADPAFLARLNLQLAKEPSLVTGSRVPLHEVSDSHVLPAVVGGHVAPASNDSAFRWKLVTGFACAAAVFSIAWNVSTLARPAAGPQVALMRFGNGAVPEQLVVASPQGPMLRNVQLEVLLNAHKQLGATPALPVPSGFLRNATFETQQGVAR